MTFSVVAFDPVGREWGVAVASKYLAAASVVSWARAESGVVATQAHGNALHGPHGLRLLSRGTTAELALSRLLEADELPEQRQIGIVDREGAVALHTGEGCAPWAGHLAGRYFGVLGNTVVPGTLNAMRSMFEEMRTGGVGLADSLVRALSAGDRAGGDTRGRQSAGVLVVREGGGPGGYGDRLVDLRVDDSLDPMRRLSNLLGLHHLYFHPSDCGRMVAIQERMADLQDILVGFGILRGPPSGRLDQETRTAITQFTEADSLSGAIRLHDGLMCVTLVDTYLERLRLESYP